MSVLIKGMKKPELCDYYDGHESYRCPLLNSNDCCRLQDCEDDWTWVDQYKGCPISEVPEQMYDETWRKEHYTASYNTGFLDGYKMAVNYYERMKG